jgi:hypothetical protein
LKIIALLGKVLLLVGAYAVGGFFVYAVLSRVASPGQMSSHSVRSFGSFAMHYVWGATALVSGLLSGLALRARRTLPWALVWGALLLAVFAYPFVSQPRYRSGLSMVWQRGLAAVILGVAAFLLGRLLQSRISGGRDIADPSAPPG